LRAQPDGPIEVPAARAPFSRRAPLDIPALPVAMAAGAENQAGGDDLDSPLDVPAFLRRQAE
jgi:hypothetical protein